MAWLNLSAANPVIRAGKCQPGNVANLDGITDVLEIGNPFAAYSHRADVAALL
jgi:hypothetical protein